MSTVMGTMRKMEDSPMDEKMTVAARSTSNGHSSTDLRGGCCNSVARKKTLVKRRRRPECRPHNGHFRRRVNVRRQEEDSDEGADGDVPMDLSKRTVEEGPVKGHCPVSDTSRGLEQEAEEQPLNLSRNTRMVALRCDSCPNVASPNNCISTSASPELLQKRVRLEEMVSCIRRSVVDNGRHKNVDCTVAAGGASDSNHGEMDDEAGEKRNVFGAVKRSLSCSSLLDSSPTFGRRRKSAATQPHKKRPRAEEEALGDPYDANGAASGGFVSYPVLRQQLLGVDCRRVGLLQSVASQDYTKDEGEYEEEEEDEEEVGGDSSERENEDNDDGGALLHHQMRLLSTAVADPTQRFPWSAYAYYANLFQELQGSLASGAAPATLPLSLALPLAMPATAESRGESPLSSEGVLMTAATPTPANAGGGDGGAANAMFRKRAPRALTGKHVKHGTGASPATLLTLRQKIEQKRKQQAVSPAHVRMDRKTGESGRLHKAIKGAPSSLLNKKKKAVS